MRTRRSRKLVLAVGSCVAASTGGGRKQAIKELDVSKPAHRQGRLFAIKRFHRIAWLAHPPARDNSPTKTTFAWLPSSAPLSLIVNLSAIVGIWRAGTYS